MMCEQVKQGVDIAINKESLIEHERRSIALEEIVKQNKLELEKRLEVIETPRKAWDHIYSVLIKLGSIAGVVTAVVGLYSLIKYLK